MGQKINPIGLRLQVNRTWDSRWFADGKEYGKLLHEDLAIREFIRKQRGQAGISRVVIERPHRKARVTIHAARPGVIIGKKGADIEKLRKKLAKLTKSELHLNIVEVRKPEIDAQLVAENIAQQLERRVSFRRAMKRAVQNAMRMGALGIRSTSAAASAAPRSPGPSGTARAGCRCTRCAPTSTTRCRGEDRLRHHRGQGLDLQGRDPRARPAGPRPAPVRAAGRRAGMRMGRGR
jgi:ribosomal protein S3